MSWMKLLPSLSLDQIGHAPCSPKCGAITQGFGTFFQPLTQLLQLNWLQTGLTARPCRLNQCLGSLLLPGLVPTADRLAVNSQSSSDFPLMEALIKKPGGSKPSPFELFKITFDAFRVTHAES
jgi:hypothetical protein